MLQRERKGRGCWELCLIGAGIVLLVLPLTAGQVEFLHPNIFQQTPLTHDTVSAAERPFIK